MAQTFKGYFLEISGVLLCVVVLLCRGENCDEDPVLINEEFMGCCKGRPLYTSEQCTDAILERSKFSPQCLLDCTYREANIYDGDSIDLANVKLFLDSQILNMDFNMVYMSAFEKCSKLEKSTMEGLFPFLNTTNVYKCDEFSYHIDICVLYYTLTNCPEKYSTTDELCQSKREWVRECVLKA